MYQTKKNNATLIISSSSFPSQNKMTTTSRLISLITGTPLFPAIQFTGKRPFHYSFSRRSFCSSAAEHHPWPEWVKFVDRLSSKGYLAKEEEEGNDVVGDGDVYRDMKLLKDACLGFARDRFDIFKSLSRQDIQTVVEKGCPNTFRKAVNSGKRLRLYVQLDERDVCGACNLRGSCDRANMILQESEGTARTADIVRILLFYALDPLLITGGQRPPGRELIESSARKLLSELVDLSETPLDPDLPKPIAIALKTTKKSSGFMDGETSQDVDMREGDWRCPKCNYLNFSRNVICRECKDKAPRKFGGVDVEMKKGDWICPECNFMNFSRNIKCLKCSTKGPTRVDAEDVEMKKGDWNCTQCGFMNFASNVKCLRCREQRPKRELEPGEWECPACDFLNYRKNVTCRKCNGERPKGHVEPQYEDQIWSRPSRQ